MDNHKPGQARGKLMSWSTFWRSEASSARPPFLLMLSQSTNDDNARWFRGYLMVYDAPWGAVHGGTKLVGWLGSVFETTLILENDHLGHNCDSQSLASWYISQTTLWHGQCPLKEGKTSEPLPATATVSKNRNLAQNHPLQYSSQSPVLAAPSSTRAIKYPAWQTTILHRKFSN